MAIALSFALHAHAADLASVYELAKSQDPGIQSARFALDAAAQKRPEALAALLPALTANASGGYTKGVTSYTNTPAVTRGFHEHDWALQLSQPIFKWQSFKALDEATALVAEAQAKFAQSQQDLILRVAQAYFDVVVAERTVRAATAQLKSVQEQLNAAQKSFDRGVASITDVDDSRSRAALAEAQRAVALNDLDNRRAALEAIVGPMNEPLAALSDSAALPSPDPADQSRWIAQAEAQGPTVRAAIAALQAAEYETARTRAQRLPTLDLVASYGSNYSSGNITNPVDYATHVRDKQVALRVNVPIFTGGSIHAQIAEASALRNKAEADVTGVKRQAALDARQAYSAVTVGLAQVSALGQAIAAGRSGVKGNRIGYGLGIRINSDVLNAEQLLFGTERDLEKARYDTLLAGLKLKAAAGELSEGDVKRISGLLQAASPNAAAPRQ